MPIHDGAHIVTLTAWYLCQSRDEADELNNVDITGYVPYIIILKD